MKTQIQVFKLNLFKELCMKSKFLFSKLFCLIFYFLVKDYTSICEEQPIGQRLFAEFCQSKPKFRHCRQCLQDIVSAFFQICALLYTVCSYKEHIMQRFNHAKKNGFIELE